MRPVLLTFAIGLLIALGLLIDAQSRPTVTHSGPDGGQTLISAEGRVEGLTPEIGLRPQLAGRVVEVLVQEGQLVTANQVLLCLDDSQYRQEEALAAADVALAEAQLERLINGAHARERDEAAAMVRAKEAERERSQLNWKRMESLLQTQAVSQQQADNERMLLSGLTGELDAARARLQRVEATARPDEIRIENARISAAKARLELTRVQVERTLLRAPCAGQILKAEIKPGELTGPSSTEPAVVLADTSRFQIRAWVDELDAPRVKVGMPARVVADGLPGLQFSGRVARLSPRMDRKQVWSDQPGERRDTKTREIWIDLDENAGLVVGLRVEVAVDPNRTPPRPPSSASPSPANAGAEFRPTLSALLASVPLGDR
jgi:multidrug resistance efflux pump